MLMVLLTGRPDALRLATNGTNYKELLYRDSVKLSYLDNCFIVILEKRAMHTRRNYLMEGVITTLSI